MVENLLAVRGIIVSHQTLRHWAEKFGRHFAGEKHWLWRAVDQEGFVLDALVQSRRNTKAAKRLMRKLLKGQGHAPHVMITDKLRSDTAAKRNFTPGVEHRSNKGA